MITCPCSISTRAIFLSVFFQKDLDGFGIW
jgi:hypothetical protein